MQEVLEGIVQEIDGEFAKLRPKRHDACDDCQACHSPSLYVLAYNGKHAELGQTVTYVQAQSGMLTIAWVLFVQPLLAVFAGIGLGAVAAPWLPVPSFVPMAVGALGLFGLTVAYIRWFDRRYKLNQSHFAKITEIIA